MASGTRRRGNVRRNASPAVTLEKYMKQTSESGRRTVERLDETLMDLARQ